MRTRRPFLISPSTEYMEERKDTARLVLGFFGIISTLIFYLIPMKIFIRALTRGSTMEFSITPFIMRFFNCWCFMWYCNFFILPNDELVFWATISGGIVSSFYVLVKYHFMFLEDDQFALNVVIANSAPLHTLLFIAFKFLDGDVRYYFWGTITTLFSIIMHAFTTWKRIRLVIMTETVEPISLVSSFFMFLDGFLWCAYGFLFLRKDPFVSVSNGVGCGVGALELALYVKYKENKVVFKIG